MDRAIQHLFQQHFAEYSKARKLPLDHHKAARSFIQCRTSALGGHVQGCANGHVEKVHYNSCKHRSCPQCNATQVTRWLAKQEAKILQCPHHHIIFTLPHELNLLWQYNKARLTQILFSSAHQTLMKLLKDPKYLGATPGIIGAFHSWGRNLSIHPHTHFLVTAGGLNSADEWVIPKKGFFLPGGVVRDMFRGQYLAMLRALLQKEELLLPQEQSTQQYLNLCNKLGRKKKFNVRIQERYDHAKGVVNYLARYARGGAIKNHQIANVGSKGVSVDYFDHREKKQSTMELTKDEFLLRVLEHVPPHRSQVIRAYGLYAGRCVGKRNVVRTQLGQQAEEQGPELDWQACCERMGYDVVTHCPICDAKIVCLRELPRKNKPP
jgi:hypothetical protein